MNLPTRPTSLYDILACPNCKTAVDRVGDALRCDACGQHYPIVNGVPVLMPDGSVPEIKHEAELTTRDSYLPWIHRNILSSLLDDQIVIEIGSGTVTLDDPCIIRTDVILTPFVDVVADAHALPFLPGSVDYIFSLAVFEHLRNPFQASQSIYDTLKDGGYVYHDCNFIIPYHGYPHHYFNATEQGMEQIFQHFTRLHQGVAPYQMPSFALELLIRYYLEHSYAARYHHGQKLVRLLEEVLQQDLRSHDIYFTEEGARTIATGTYFAGLKQQTPDASLIPEPLRQLWETEPALQERFPDVNDLTAVDNLLRWARGEGCEQYAQVRTLLETLVPFNKRGPDAAWDRSRVRAFPPMPPVFGAIGFDPALPMAENARLAQEQTEQQNALARVFWRTMDTVRYGGVGALLQEARSFFAYHLGAKPH